MFCIVKGFSLILLCFLSPDTGLPTVTVVDLFNEQFHDHTGNDVVPPVPLTKKQPLPDISK